ncbi:hypothetical protein EJ05DRAFT_246085 [Pseudovirgaria hyperparasitica]|uniref:Uncharacterized protein n=1 Tax=Pseudovirgaria hyperparasitica TaxID=470096 RepID=A0A6A6WDX7_9PEZI|nr:uncharacterized protein EJ05DRAFT_246085 [Pseudovirgaria hyperparasitica]KAF2760913.1 hypothetical protein EJ05DRAFT_246085 [Pseudovirgaria hyperparasitica]
MYTSRKASPQDKITARFISIVVLYSAAISSYEKRIESLSSSTDAAAENDDKEHDLRRHLVELIERTELLRPPIDRSTRLTYIGTDVSNFNHLIRNQFDMLITDLHHFPINRITRRSMMSGPGTIPDDALQRLIRPVYTRQPHTGSGLWLAAINPTIRKPDLRKTGSMAVSKDSSGSIVYIKSLSGLQQSTEWLSQVPSGSEIMLHSRACTMA